MWIPAPQLVDARLGLCWSAMSSEKSPRTDSSSNYLTASPNLWPLRWCNQICFWFSCLKGRLQVSSSCAKPSLSPLPAKASSLSTSNLPCVDTHAQPSGEMTSRLKHFLFFTSYFTAFCLFFYTVETLSAVEWLYVGYLKWIVSALCYRQLFFPGTTWERPA